MLLVFFTIIIIYITDAQVDKKYKRKKIFENVYIILVILLSFIMGVIYIFIPELNKSITGIDSNIHTLYLGYLSMSISLISIFPLVFNWDIDSKLITSIIWGVYLLLISSYQMYNYLNEIEPFTWGGNGMGIPYILSSIILLWISLRTLYYEKQNGYKVYY